MASLAFIVSAYLVGSMPQVYWMVRFKGAQIGESDLHEHLWSLSHKLGAIGFIVDLAKGAFVVLAGKWLGFPLEVVAFAGLSAVIGQMWPAYLVRSGGGGNTTGMTVALTLALSPFLIALLPVLAGISWRVGSHVKNRQPPFGPPHSKSLPLSMFLAFAILPAASALLKEPLPVTLSFLGIFIAVMVRRFVKGLRKEILTGPIRAKKLLRYLIFD